MRVPLLGFGQEHAEVVDWSLDALDLAFFCTFNNERCAYYTITCCHVEVYLLSFLGYRQDWWGRKCFLQVHECLSGFLRPLEFLSFPEQLIEGQRASPSLLMKRLRAASLPVSCCTPLTLVGSFIRAMAWTFSWFASIPRAETM